LLVLLRRWGFSGSVSSGGKKKKRQERKKGKQFTKTIYIVLDQLTPSNISGSRGFVIRHQHVLLLLARPPSVRPPVLDPYVRPSVRQAASDDQRWKAQIFLQVSFWRGGFLQKFVATDEKLPECDSGN
jgi:hypothetical protein